LFVNQTDPDHLEISSLLIKNNKLPGLNLKYWQLLFKCYLKYDTGLINSNIRQLLALKMQTCLNNNNFRSTKI